MRKQTTVTLDLGGRHRVLRLDMNALCALEEVDLDLSTLGEQLRGGKGKVSTIRKMVWAFLSTDAEDHGEELTVRQVGKWIDLDNMAECGKAVGKLLAGDRKPEEIAEPDPTDPSV